MGITSIQSIQNANTVFEAAFQKLFAGGPQGFARQFTQVIPNKAKALNIPVVSAFPRFREWVGAKQYLEPKAYSFTLTTTKYEASIEVPRFDVEYDLTGAVGSMLSNFVASSEFWLDDLVVAALIANPTAYDGSALLSATRSWSTGNVDNLEAAAPTFALWQTARKSMRLNTDERGKPLGVKPTHLLVGPTNERIGMEITGSDRPATLSTAGGMDAGASVQAAVTLSNYIGGDCALMVSDYITGNQWFAMDLSKPGLRPMIYGEAAAPHAIYQTALDGESRMERDVFKYSIEADGVVGAGLPQLLHGSVSA